MSTRKKKSTIELQKIQILAFLTERSIKGADVESICRAIGETEPDDRIFVELMLQELEETGKISREKGRYSIGQKSNPNEVTGRLDFVNANFGFIRHDDAQSDVFVSIDDINGAFDGDTVRARITGQRKNGKNPEGRIIEIIERGKKSLVGKIKVYGNYALVTPDNRGFHGQIFIPKAAINAAETNDLVIVKIIEYPVAGAQAVGEIVEVLGQSGDNNAEMNAIMAEFGLPVHFPKEVLEESERISESISASEIKKRRDFRETLTFTIDPADAKDFDDALSFKALENGNYEIGIHIADVSHYLVPNTALDDEAKIRATSVYLVDRTIPMLPEKLSNNLCSLRPNEDKLVFSAVFEMNAEAEVIKQWFGRSIIHSDRRFSYEQAQEVIEDTTDNEPVYSPMLKLLNSMALKLRTGRFAKGAFNFETNEVKFQLDETGRPIGVYQKIRKDAHKLIEEFMLLANKKVAEFVAFKSKEYGIENPFTMVYRIHEPPNPTKVEAFAKFAIKLGFMVKTGTSEQLSKSLNGLMHKIEGTPMQNVLESLAVRTMSKARYTTNNVGHFGLAFDHYSHFTSPIRRYPDVMAHRMLQHYLDGGKSLPEAEFEAQCKQSSDMEKLASEAERASIKYKQVEYMSYQSRTEVFEGVVTGVTDFGIFVEIANTSCEGMVRLADLQDDFYEFDADNFRVVGRRKGKIIGFGNKVNVKILNTDIEKRSMDLTLVSVEGSQFASKESRPSFKSDRRNGGGGSRKGGDKGGNKKRRY